ncbi:MAG TPA: hypothetical protein DCY35_03510 [Prolixibacteraceae bacterium]|nr:hypothetical protein [Prolixibacteraceae bacterium]
MLIGSYLGMAGYPEVDPVNDRFFTNLINWARINRPFTSNLDGRTSNQVEVRLLENANGYLLFTINHSEKKESFHVDLKVPDGNYRIRDVIRNNSSTQTGKNHVLRLSSEIDSKQVIIWEITAN